MLNLYYFFRFLECGHFCIKYVLKKDNIKLDVIYNKQLMSLGLVSRVLKNYYQDVTCFKAESIEDIIGLPRFITLIKISENKFHYVVIECIKDGYVFYYDPAFIGIRRVKFACFIKKWTFYCCLFKKSKC